MIARKSFIIMITQTASAVVGLLALTIVSKLWGSSAPSLMGVVWFGMAFVGTFSFITNLGFDSTHVKKVSEGKDIGTCIGTFIAIKLILVSILVITVVGGIAIWKYVLNKDFYDATRESVIYIFLGFYVLFALAQIPIMTFNSLRKNVKSQASMFMEPLVRSPLMILVALAGVTGAIVVLEGSTEIINLSPAISWPSILQPVQEFLATHTIGAFAFAYLFGAFAMFLVGFIMLRKYPISRPTREYFLLYLKFATPLMIPVLFTLVILNVDKVMLGYFWSSVEVGHYFAVQRITTLILLIYSAIGVVLFPTVSSIHAKYKYEKKKRNKAILRVIRSSERYSSMVIVPIVFIILAFAIPVIDILLNSSFRPAVLSLQILTVYTYVLTLGMPYRFLILGMDRPTTFAKVMVMGGITNIVLNLFLIPEDGLLSQLDINGPSGAALSALISSLVMLVGFHYYSRKIIKFRRFQNRILLHIVAGLLMGLILWKLASYVPQMQWFYLVGLSLIGVGVYLVFLWLLREFSKAELNFFLETVNPKNLLRYIKSEIKEKP
jgi:O-antigen/teichoic acid export membrane protein